MERSGIVSLQITKTNGRYSFTLQDHARLPLAYEVFLTVPPATREEIVAMYRDLLTQTSQRMRSRSAGSDLASNLETHRSDNDLAITIGDSIARFLFPRELAYMLTELAPSSLLITTNDPVIPWEMTRLSGYFLSSRVALGKCVKTTLRLAKVRSWEPRRRISLLLVANPTCDLPGAYREHQELVRLLDRDIHYDLTVLRENEATFRSVADVMMEKNIDILHYAGHTSYGTDDSEEPTFYFHDTAVSAQYFVNLLGEKCPPLLFLNSCNSALINSPGIQQNYLGGLSPHFLHAGAIGVIGALWPVIDESALEISKSFYAALSKGLSIGESLRRAKVENERPDLPAAWTGYTLVGDPDLVLIDDTSWKTKHISRDGYASARELFSGDSLLAIGGIHPFLVSAEEHDACLVAVSSDCVGCQSLILRKGLEETNLNALKGMRIGVTPSTGMHVFLYHNLDEAGLTLSDFTIIFLEKGEIVEALCHGRIDAAVIWEPWQTQLIEKGHQRIIPRTDSTNYTMCCVAARRQDLDNQSPELIEALRRYYYCVDLIRNGKFNYVQLLSLQFDLSYPIVHQAANTFKFLGSATLGNEGVLERYRAYAEVEMDFMLDRGLLRRPFPFERFWTPLPPAELVESLNFDAEPLPVMIQESISCAPFILGRFLGLFY